MQPAYKAVVFDMDGTLIDSERVLLDVWISVASEKGYVFSREIMETTIGTTTADTIDIMREAYPDAPHDEIRAEMSARFRELRENGLIGLRPGVLDALEVVYKAGMKIGLCTSTRSASAEATLKSLDIYRYFDAAAYGDEVTRGKPDPEPYLLAAAKLCIDPGDCLAVEDSPFGAMSALAAGMAVAFVPDVIPAPGDLADKIIILNNIAEIASLIYPQGE